MIDSEIDLSHNPFKNQVKFFKSQCLENLENMMNLFMEKLPPEMHVKYVNIYPGLGLHIYVGMVVYV
jgi:hypothetical protein